MMYKAKIEGITPLLMHSAVGGMDTRSPLALEAKEITTKKASNRTEEDEDLLRQISCQQSMWVDGKGRPTLPCDSIRACIEAAARKLKQGPQVREGLLIERVDFSYDESLGKTAFELRKKIQHTVPVVVQRARLLRTRAEFKEWSAEITLEGDSELVDRLQLEQWFEIAGQRIGVGDWRPQKSGTFGRFVLKEIKEI